MANNINTNYSTYQKPLNHIGGKRDAGRKKGVEKEDKEKKPFGEDFGVQLSDAGLAALELQRKQKAKDEEGGETSLISEDKLSDKAKNFLSQLREKQGTKAYSVLLTNDEIEKMANDEEYAEKVMQRIESAVDMTKRIEEKGELGEGVHFKHISIAFDSDGNMKLFAELEKMSEKQKERMEKAKEKRAEEKDETEKAKDKDDGKDDPRVRRVRLSSRGLAAERLPSPPIPLPAL